MTLTQTVSHTVINKNLMKTARLSFQTGKNYITPEKEVISQKTWGGIIAVGFPYGYKKLDPLSSPVGYYYTFYMSSHDCAMPKTLIN